MRKDAAFQILLEGLSNVGPWRAMVALPVELALAGLIKPGLVVRGYRLVQQRAFGVAGLQSLGLADMNTEKIFSILQPVTHHNQPSVASGARRCGTRTGANFR